MLRLHMHTIHLRKYFHLPQVIGKQQPRQGIHISKGHTV